MERNLRTTASSGWKIVAKRALNEIDRKWIGKKNVREEVINKYKE